MQDEYKNPSVRGYEVAISYSKSQLEYAVEIFNSLIQEKIDVFLYETPEFLAKLGGSPVADSLQTILMESLFVLVIIGEDYKRDWPDYEGKIIKHRIAEKGGYSNLILIDNFDAKELIEEWKISSLIEKSKVDILTIVKQLKNRVHGMKSQQEEAVDVSNAQVLQMIERYLPMAKKHWIGEAICPETNEPITKQCMGAHMSGPFAATLGSKQKYIRLGRVLRILHEIERVGSSEYPMLFNLLSNRFLLEFTNYGCRSDGIGDEYHESIKGIQDKKCRARLPGIYKEIEVSVAMDRIRGFLEHHTLDRHPVTKFLDSLSFYLKVNHQGIEKEGFLRKSAQFCVEAGQIADKMYEVEALPSQAKLYEWSKELMVDLQDDDAKKHIQKIQRKLVSFNQRIIKGSRLSRARRY